jgi:hypothetical protein
MSHYAKLTVNFKQAFEKELIESLIKIFDKVEVHAEAQDLQLYTGENATKDRSNHADPCHIIVRKQELAKRKGMAYSPFNDLGYRRDAKGGYEAYIDHAGVQEADIGLIAQDYALKVAQKQLTQSGYGLSKRVQLEDGSVRLEMVAYR